MKLRAILAFVLISSASAAYALAEEAPAIWIDVPFVAQIKNGCGSASVSMVLKYWEKRDRQAASQSADPEKIQADLFSPELGGIPASSMQKYFQESGYRTFAFQGAWTDLQ